MKTIIIILSIWYLNEATVSAEYRFKRRGPAPPQRVPSVLNPPAYLKKWQVARPHRGVVRLPRPIPVHTHSQMFGKVPYPIGPITIKPPNRIYQQSAKTPLRKPTIKPFQSSRPLNFQPDLDYHIQTNNIPNQIPIQNKVVDLGNQTPIKQLDEKGPIHTIPAPNLSRDKPYKPDETLKDGRYYQEKHNLNRHLQQNYHQYQVTENNDQMLKLGHLSRTYADPSQIVKINQHNQTAYIQASPQLIATDTYQNIPIEHTLSLPSNNVNKLSLASKTQVNNENIQQYLNNYGQEDKLLKLSSQNQNINDKKQAVASYQTDKQSISNLQTPDQNLKYQSQFINARRPQPHLQLNIPDYQTIIKQAQMFQTEPAYLSQVQQAIGQNANDKAKVQLHNFNYEDQFSKNNNGDGISVKFPEYETDSNPQVSSNLFKQDFNTQHQNAYLQHLLDSNNDDSNARSDQNNKNDSSPSIISDRQDNDELSNFYMTLPNKEAAEALASLQEAGKINSNLLHMKSQEIQSLNLQPKNPLTIYVSEDDDGTDTEGLQLTNIKNQLDEQNEEFIKEDLNGLENEETVEDNKSFGDKITPKRRIH